MAKNMSFNSVSYNRVSSEFEAQSERFQKEVSYLPVRSTIENKPTQLSYLKDYTSGLQSVFRAEFVKTMTKSQIQKHLESLKIELEEIAPEKIFKISCHPQSDATTKSSHFHIWGDITPEMEKVFVKYLINNRLTIQSNVNITAIERGQLRKVELNGDGNEEIRRITFNDETGHYIVGKNEIKSRNATESVVIDVLKIEKEEESIIDAIDAIDKELQKSLDSSNAELEKLMASAEFEEFERKFNSTFDILNQNIDIFMSENNKKVEELERKIKDSLKLTKE